jgi:pyrimidine-specific ribonucleoside hydrolase
LQTPLLQKISKMELTIPSVFDMDIGKDPDDTCVALVVARNQQKFNSALIITNDEAKSRGRVKFLSDIIHASGSDVKVAGGLPSNNKYEDTLVERAGIVSPNRLDPGEDGIECLTKVLDAHKRVNYFGLGALTNLAAVLKQHPEFAERINLVQMGPSLQGAYRKKAPQYNVRIDVGSFREVLSKVAEITLLMSHASWGSYTPNPLSRQQLGVYVDDPFYNALIKSGNLGLDLFARHLKAWKDDGKPCSIMHDPLTVLSFFHTGIVDYIGGEIVMDGSGFADLTEKTRDEVRSLNQNRLLKLNEYLRSPPVIKEGLVKKVTFSLNTDYDAAREKIVESLFGESQRGLAAEWKKYNQNRTEDH